MRAQTAPICLAALHTTSQRSGGGGYNNDLQTSDRATYPTGASSRRRLGAAHDCLRAYLFFLRLRDPTSRGPMISRRARVVFCNTYEKDVSPVRHLPLALKPCLRGDLHALVRFVLEEPCLTCLLACLCSFWEIIQIIGCSSKEAACCMLLQRGMATEIPWWVCTTSLSACFVHANHGMRACTRFASLASFEADGS